MKDFLKMEKGYEKVTCEFCDPPRSWWSHHPLVSKRNHVRKFHPEDYAKYRHPNEIGELT